MTFYVGPGSCCRSIPKTRGQTWRDSANAITWDDRTTTTPTLKVQAYDAIEQAVYFEGVVDHTYASWYPCRGSGRCKITIRGTGRQPTANNPSGSSTFFTLVPDLGDLSNNGSPAAVLDPYQNAYKQPQGYEFYVQATDPDESAMSWSWTGYTDSGIPYNGNAWSDSRMMWRDSAPFGATSPTGWPVKRLQRTFLD